MHDRLGIRYMNCGDWVESCTALVETYDGAFELIRWPLEAEPDWLETSDLMKAAAERRCRTLERAWP